MVSPEGDELAPMTLNIDKVLTEILSMSDADAGTLRAIITPSARLIMSMPWPIPKKQIN
jgi:hypothetical protein